MKKITLFLTLSIIYSGVTTAQTIPVPDINFENALVNLGIDLNGLNGNIEIANAQGVTSLDVSGQNISDLSGIEAFTNLTALDCRNNQLTSLNLNANTSLSLLICNNNQLTSLNTTQIPALSQLICNNNQITSLDLSLNTSLSLINCSNNLLDNLNVKNGFNTNIGISFNATGNTNLVCIEVDDTAYSNTNWLNIDPQSNFSLNCVYIDVPDTNFEQRLVDLNIDNNGLNGNIWLTEAQAVSTLYIPNESIADLTGIEAFTNLIDLDCSSNLLTNLDLTQNTNLEILNFSNNTLTSIDLSQNTSLTSITCQSNNITNLDLSSNTALTNLICSSNQISSLNLSQNIFLSYLDCQGNNLTNLNVGQNELLLELEAQNNNLTSLDLSNNNNLTKLFCFFNNLSILDLSLNDQLVEIECQNNPSLSFLNVKNGNNTFVTNFRAQNNPSLSCIEVDNVVYSTNNWTNVDPQSVFSTDCSSVATIAIPDNNFEQRLVSLGIDTNGLNGNITLSDAQGFTGVLNLNFQGISDLTGIAAFTNMTILNCNDNLLTTIDVSQNTNLTSLTISGNQLTSLDVSNNTLLTSISCPNNQISQLDFSFNTQLVNCIVNNNQLTSLNVKNGNNSNSNLFDARNNSNLFCIQVDNVTYSTTNWTNIDGQTSFSEDCSTLSLSNIDINKLINLYPNPAKNQISIEAPSNLTITSIGIFDLSGKQVSLFKNISQALDITHLPSGFYMVSIELQEKIIIKKLIVE